MYNQAQQATDFQLSSYSGYGSNKKRGRAKLCSDWVKQKKLEYIKLEIHLPIYYALFTDKRTPTKFLICSKLAFRFVLNTTIRSCGLKKSNRLAELNLWFFDVLSIEIGPCDLSTLTTPHTLLPDSY